MQDMLVRLYDLPEGAESAAAGDGEVVIRRAMAPDMLRVVEFVRNLSGVSAAGECTMCFRSHPITCYIATRGNQILGYACYNATASAPPRWMPGSGERASAGPFCCAVWHPFGKWATATPSSEASAPGNFTRKPSAPP